MSLMQIMLATAILAIAVVGASGYRYYAALDARRASARVTAARIALMLCETWRGQDGSDSFAPASCFSSSELISDAAGPSAPVDYTALGSCSVSLNGFTYYVTCSWRDVNSDLRAMNVLIWWPSAGAAASSVAACDQSFSLTTYANI
jgi:hypothetical protein